MMLLKVALLKEFSALGQEIFFKVGGISDF